MATTELREDNILARVIDAIRTESKAVTIAGIAMVVAFLALMMAWIALDSAKTAEIRSELQTQHIEDLSDKIGVLEVRVINAEKKHE